MNRDEIFEKILSLTADATKVPVETIKDKTVKARRVVRARAIVLFWCDTACLDDEDIAECTGYSANGIKKVRDTLEERWNEDACFRLMTMDVGRRCDEFLQQEGIVVDMVKVYNKWQNITGRSRIRPAEWKRYNEP